MNEKVRLFLEDLRHEIEYSALGNKINSVCVFGSFTDRSWVEGSSDVDLVVIINNKEEKSEVEHFLTETFAKLDDKYSLGLKKASFPKKTGKFMPDLIRKVDHFVAGPINIFSVDKLHNNFCAFDDTKIWIVTTFFVPRNTFLFALKTKGITLYGEDHISKLNITRVKPFEKIRLIMGQLILTLLALIAIPFLPSFSAKYFCKICRYEVGIFLYCKNIIIDSDHEEEFFCNVLDSPFIASYLDTLTEIKKIGYTKIGRITALKLFCKTIMFLFISQYHLFINKGLVK